MKHWLFAFGMTALLAMPAKADVNIDFENFQTGYVPITTQYSGLAGGPVFSSASTLSNSDSTLSPLYPPHSGNTVAFDDQFGTTPGTIRVDFTTAMQNHVGGYITGTTAITEEIYDSSNNLLGSVSTPGANYIGSGGPPPNFLLDLSSVGNNIAYVLFHDSGNTFTLDDFHYGLTATATPEPSTMVIAGLAGVIGLAYAARRRKVTM